MVSFMHPQNLSPSLHLFTTMEDWNTLAADCVVVSCCCQCLILQILVFVLLKLPRKLIRKTKKYAKKKLLDSRKVSVKGGHEGEVVELDKGYIMSVGIEELGMDGLGCMKEVEKVLEELCRNGKFAFGSFWGEEGSMCIAKNEYNLCVLEHQLNEIVTSIIS